MLRRKRVAEPETYTVDDDSEPSELANEIRLEFIRQRKAIYPNAQPPGKRYTATFIQAADRCLGSGMSAGEFVRAALASAMQWGVPLFPQSLLTRIDQSATEASVDKLNTYKAMLATFDVVVMIYGPHMVLADPRSYLSPLLRYSLARRYGFADIAEANQVAASSECATLGELVSELFPEELKALHVV